MHKDDLDLNLLRLFDAVYIERNVSRAAERLGLTQPAVSQGLGRLRRALGDPLFVRAPGGVKPSARAEQLAGPLATALQALDQALREPAGFDPVRSHRVFRLHLSDIGEARFLPELMQALRHEAPGVRLETRPWPHEELAGALDAGRVDLALGFLPGVTGTCRQALLQDRYIVMLRAGHPLLASLCAAGAASAPVLALLEYAAVRSHADTLRILHALQLEHRLRLTAAHFLALPAIVKHTDVAVLMPRNIALGFAASGEYALVEPELPLRDFVVSLHWSERQASDPAIQWLRALLQRLFGTRAGLPLPMATPVTGPELAQKALAPPDLDRGRR